MENVVRLDIAVEKLSRTFGDLHYLRSNVTRARRLWRNRPELEEEESVKVMEAERSITQKAVSKSRVRDEGKRIAYFFAVLEDRLGLLEKWSGRSERGG